MVQLIKRQSIKQCHALLKGIAIIDVKKINNSNSTSNNSIINKYAKNDKELLEEQNKIINPNIILCGATFSSYKIIFENSPEIKKISSKCFIHNDRLIIDFEHVSAHKKIDVLINKLDSILTSEVLDYCKTIIKSKWNGIKKHNGKLIWMKKMLTQME